MRAKRQWWRIAAVMISGLTVVGGVGNLIDDDGPMFGKIAYLVVASVGAALVASGFATKERSRGSLLIGIGVMPGYPLTMFFWFPPVALIGILSIAVTVAAVRDYIRRAVDERTAVVSSPG